MELDFPVRQDAFPDLNLAQIRFHCAQIALAIA